MSRLLTLEVARELAEGTNIREIKRLDASKRGIARVNDLSPCVELARLDLSRNSVTNLEGLFYCKTLTWLDVSHNQLESLLGIQALTNLVVLRASHNAIAVCGDLSSLKNLKALILNDNRLSVLQGLSKLKDLNTLVLSKNLFESLSLGRLTKLTKVSLSHNLLRTIPNTEHLSELKEVRLNDNKISDIPDSLQLNSRLILLDLGNNKLKDFSALHALRGMTQLKNLNFKGNTLCDTAEDYQGKVVGFVPSVQVLDGRKLAEVRKSREKSANAGKKGTQLKSRPISSEKKQSKGSQKKLSKSTEEQFDLKLKPKKRKHEADVEMPLSKKSKLSKKYQTEYTEETAPKTSKRTEGTQKKRGDTAGNSSGSSRSQKCLELRADEITDGTRHGASRNKKKKRKSDQRETIGGDDDVSTVTVPQDHSMVTLGVETATGLETETLQALHEKKHGENPTLGLARHALGKSHPSKSKKARSGVVAVEEIRPSKRKKQYSPSRFMELVRTESIGTGQESMWT